MPGKILCVAEKPSISKAVAGILSGGQFQTVSQVKDLLGNWLKVSRAIHAINTQRTISLCLILVHHGGTVMLL
jgi:hypothetical protein